MKISINQKGLSSILFAMIFATILSLLAIGFATLARNDQRQALDQTLGYQAQYAAETAVNQVRAKIATGGINSTSTGCTQDITDLTNSGSGVTVPCVDWSNIGPNIIMQGVTGNPRAYQLMTTGDFTELTIYWELDSPSNQYVTTANSQFPDAIDNAHYPILKLALHNGTNFKQFYVVPNGANSGVALSAATGAVYNADCSGTACTTTITSAGSLRNVYLAVSVLGQTAQKVTITPNNGVQFEDVQYTIDATAIAQDVTKRVEARVPASANNAGSWRSGYSVSAGLACKDIKIDGSNDTGISTDTSCADRL